MSQKPSSQISYIRDLEAEIFKQSIIFANFQSVVVNVAPYMLFQNSIGSWKQSVAGGDCEKPKTDVELFAWLVLFVYSPQLSKRGCGGGRALT